MPITDADIDKALDWLVRNAEKAAQARANRVLLEESSRSVKADLMKASGQDTIGLQERDAYSAPEYRAHIVGLAAAVHEDERLRLLRMAAEARIECWRTMCSNQRTMGKVV